MSTQLGDYYDALCALKEQELTALAVAHADDPRLLVHRFRQSVEKVESRARIDAPFHEGGRKRLERPKEGKITRTPDFASYLCDGRAFAVKGEEKLTFRYIDREIFPGRTPRKDQDRRCLDFLLANSRDHTPVFAELKIGHDKLAYFALIQVLMLAAEFQSKDQRERLQKDYKWGKDLNDSPEGPFADLYIIVYDHPERGGYRERNFNATKLISEQLLADAYLAQYIRRIACLRASKAPGEEMAFEKCFAFGPGL